MKTITIVALVTAIGSSAALAQGLPPGSSAWQTSAGSNGGSNAVASAQVNPGSRMAVAKKSGAVPVASGLPGHYRRA
jgi:hypothetical protein